MLGMSLKNKAPKNRGFEYVTKQDWLPLLRDSMPAFVCVDHFHLNKFAEKMSKIQAIKKFNPLY
jgi:hypothetical protein